MGQTFSNSPYSVLQETKDTIDNNSCFDIINNNLDEVQKISLDDSVYRNAVNTKYIIKLKSIVQNDIALAILFPTHPEEKKRTLWTQNYYGRPPYLSKTINERINESLNKDAPQFCLVCNKQYLLFEKIVGKIYLFFAEEINISEYTKKEKVTKKNVPIIVETNGQMSVRNIFIVPESDEKNYPLNIENVTILLQPGDDYYCCDIDPRHDKNPVIETKTETEVNTIIRQVVQANIKLLDDSEIPFGGGLTSDNEDNEELEITIDSSRVRRFNYKQIGEQDFDEK